MYSTLVSVTRRVTKAFPPRIITPSKAPTPETVKFSVLVEFFATVGNLSFFHEMFYNSFLVGIVIFFSLLEYFCNQASQFSVLVHRGLY